MTDTDVTFLPKYHNMDPARLYLMILTSPPSLPRSRLWSGLGVRWPSQSHPVIQGLPVLESLPFNSLSVPTNTEGREGVVLSQVLIEVLLVTTAELEALHQQIVQNTAQIIDDIRSLDIYAIAWVERTLKNPRRSSKNNMHAKISMSIFFFKKEAG